MSYYHSKSCVIFGKKEGALDKVHLKVKDQIGAVNKHDKYFLLRLHIEVTSIMNTLKFYFFILLMMNIL